MDVDKQSPTGHDGKAQMEWLFRLLTGHEGGVAGEREK